MKNKLFVSALLVVASLLWSAGLEAATSETVAPNQTATYEKTNPGDDTLTVTGGGATVRGQTSSPALTGEAEITGNSVTWKGRAANEGVFYTATGTMVYNATAYGVGRPKEFTSWYDYQNLRRILLTPVRPTFGHKDHLLNAGQVLVTITGPPCEQSWNIGVIDYNYVVSEGQTPRRVDDQIVPMGMISGKYVSSKLVLLNGFGAGTTEILARRAGGGDELVASNRIPVTVVKVENCTVSKSSIIANNSLSDATVSATVTPAGRTLTYSIVGDSLGCTIDEATGVVTASFKAGAITVRAQDSEVEEAYADTTLQLTATEEWRKEDENGNESGIYGVEGLEKYYPSAANQTGTHDLLHFDNTENGNPPDVNKFQLKYASTGHGDIDSWKETTDDGVVWHNADVGINIDSSDPNATKWSVDVGGSVAPEMGEKTTFKPSKTVQTVIKVSVVVKDNAPTAAANDSDIPSTSPGFSYGSLRTFKLETQISLPTGGNLIKIPEDGEVFSNGEGFEQLIPISAASMNTLAKSLTTTGTTDAPAENTSWEETVECKSTAGINDDVKWITKALTSNGVIAGTCEGKVEIHPSLRMEGGMTMTLSAPVTKVNPTKDYIITKLVELGGELIPGCGTLASIGTDAIEAYNATCANGAILGSVGIQKLDQSIQVCQESKVKTFTLVDVTVDAMGYVHYHYENIPVVRSIDLNDVEIDGKVQVDPGAGTDTIVGLYCLKATLFLEDDAILTNISGSITITTPKVYVGLKALSYTPAYPGTE